MMPDQLLKWNIPVNNNLRRTSDEWVSEWHRRKSRPVTDESKHEKSSKSTIAGCWRFLLPKSDNVLPSSQTGGKLRRFRMSQGFYWRKLNVERVQMGNFENDNSFLLQRLQVDNCNFENDHCFFEGMMVMVNWDVLRMITASYWIVANFPNQSISLFHSPLLSELRWHLPLQGRKFPARKRPRFVWCKAIYGSICYMAVTKLPSISTWWSKTHTIYHIFSRNRCDLIFLSRMVLFSHNQDTFFMVTPNGEWR